MRQDLSLLRLFGYCTIAALAAAFGLALLFAGASVVFAGQEATAEAAAQSNFSGMITDEHCRAKHERYPGKSASECARLCALNGSKYVLLDGDKVYVLVGKDLTLDKLAGERATVSGSLEGSTITVTSVAAAH